jgi:hypothetical protein
MITLLSRLRGDLGVEVDRRPAADERVGAVDRVDRVARRLDDVERRLRGDVGVTLASNQARRRLTGSAPSGLPAVDPALAPRSTSGSWSALATTCSGVGLSARSWSVSTFWPLMESNSLV